MRRSLVWVGAIVVWAAVSVVALWRLPIGVGMIYVIVCAVGASFVRRRDARRRRDDLAPADDLLRGGPGDRPQTRPRGHGYGLHSWGRHDGES